VGIRESTRNFRIDVSPSIFLEKMKEKRMHNYSCKIPLTAAEINARKKLVDWVCDIGDTLRLSPETIHKSVGFIDHIMCENRLEESELQDIALICMLLSAKLSERDPEVEGIIAFFRNKMHNPKLDIMKYEVQVMHHLNWDLQGVTPMEFIQFFVSQGITYNNDIINSSNPNEQNAKSLRQYSEFFADLCLQEYEFINADPLILAAGVIAASRKVLKFSKIWTNELEALTTIMQNEAESCASIILNYYEKLFPKNQKTNGIHHQTNNSLIYKNKENMSPNGIRPMTANKKESKGNISSRKQAIKRYL